MPLVRPPSPLLKTTAYSTQRANPDSPEARLDGWYATPGVLPHRVTRKTRGAGWTGEYEFYLDFHDRSDVLSGSVSPASATVDGEVSLTVTVEASESAPIGQDAFGIYAESTSGGILQEISGRGGFGRLTSRNWQSSG